MSGSESAPRPFPQVPLEPLRPADPREAGPFRLLGRLGSGGTGVAYLADDGQQWAVVKVIRPDLADDRMFLARLARELEAMRLTHGPHTAALLNADMDVQPPWFAMEFIPGSTLARTVEDTGPLPPDAVEEFAAQLAAVLGAIHEAGVVHRDLKPGNIMLSPDGPRVIDFGIADLDHGTQLTRTGLVLGTAGWLAPEQIRGEPVGPATDVHAWALCVLFAATGERPFGADNTSAAIYKVLETTPVIPSDLPAPLNQLLADALAKDPAQRPSVGRILQALTGEAASGEPPTAVGASDVTQPRPFIPPTRAEPAETSPEKRRGRPVALIAAVAAVIAVLLVAVGAVIAISSGNQAPAAQDPAALASPTGSTAAATSSSASAAAAAPRVIPSYEGTLEGSRGADDLERWLHGHRGQVVWLDVYFRSVPTDTLTPDEGTVIEFVRDTCPTRQQTPDGFCYPYAVFHVRSDDGDYGTDITHGVGHINGYFSVEGTYDVSSYSEVQELLHLTSAAAAEATGGGTRDRTPKTPPAEPTPKPTPKPTPTPEPTTQAPAPTSAALPWPSPASPCRTGYPGYRMDPSLARTTDTDIRNHVAGIQDFLRTAYYNGYLITDVGRADGVYGPRTTQGVTEYQALRGLPVDGWVGPITWGDMQKMCAKNGW